MTARHFLDFAVYVHLHSKYFVTRRNHAIESELLVMFLAKDKSSNKWKILRYEVYHEESIDR